MALTRAGRFALTSARTAIWMSRTTPARIDSASSMDIPPPVAVPSVRCTVIMGAHRKADAPWTVT